MTESKAPDQRTGQMVERALRFIESKSPAQVIVLSVFLLAGVAAGDYFTGYEVHFFLFYYLPVALLAWRVRLRWALIMGLACAVVWYRVDTWLRPETAVSPVEIWNGVIRLGAFFILGVTLSYLRGAHRESQRLNDQLRESLASLKASMAEAEKLRSTVQTVCSWSKRIKDEGKWISLEEFMNKYYGVQFTHGMSEDIARELRRQAEDGYAE